MGGGSLEGRVGSIKLTFFTGPLPSVLTDTLCLFQDACSGVFRDTFSVLGCCSFSGICVTGFVCLIHSHESTWQLAFDKSEDLQPVLF